ncbi:MAG: ATP-binding cassette domain-containing protein [Nanoarchaeota archaeon]|nr:ATP-binding cassette domain-containing protein [Nanoarchaeota archaeon]
MVNIIEIKNLNYSYNKKENILENVSLSVEKKDLVAIVGHNGSGKSTLIKLILGLIENKNGKINVKGKLAYIPQKYNQDINFPGKVKEILNLECCDCNLREDVLVNLGVENLQEKQFKSLSGGQQQRVLIALSLLSNPDILVLDEPTVGVDTKTQEEFYKLLKKLNKERELTILFVTHDTGMISNYFTKTICVGNKKVHIDDAKNIHTLLHSTYGNTFHELHHHHHNSNNGGINKNV